MDTKQKKKTKENASSNNNNNNNQSNQKKKSTNNEEQQQQQQQQQEQQKPAQKKQEKKEQKKPENENQNNNNNNNNNNEKQKKSEEPQSNVTPVKEETQSQVLENQNQKKKKKGKKGNNQNDETENVLTNRTEEELVEGSETNRTEVEKVETKQEEKKKQEEIKQEEVKTNQPETNQKKGKKKQDKQEEVKAKQEETKQQETKQQETKQQETKLQETKQEEVKTKQEEVKTKQEEEVKTNQSEANQKKGKKKGKKENTSPVTTTQEVPVQQEEQSKQQEQQQEEQEQPKQQQEQKTSQNEDVEGVVEEVQPSVAAPQKNSQKTKQRNGPLAWDDVKFVSSTWKPVLVRGQISTTETNEVTFFLESELPEIFGKYEWLCEQEDDPSTPFNSKYTARDKMLEMRERICNLLNISETIPAAGSVFPKTGEKRLLHSLAYIDYKIGVNYIQTEELHSGQMFIDNCLQHFSNHMDVFPVEVLDCYNQLGILWCNREEYEKSEKFLKSAERFYKDLIDGENTKESFLESLTEQEKELHMSELNPCKDLERIEKLYTLTCFFLAQVYGRQQKSNLSADYCQRCLQRQVESTEPVNYIDFSYNCIGLYNYYVMIEHYTQAEYSLHAASYMLSKADPEIRTQQYTDREGGTRQAFAELDRAWGKFYGMILQRGQETKFSKNPKSYTSKPLSFVYPTLPTFNLVATSLPSTFEEALKLFKLAEHSFEKAKEYFKFDGWVTDHLDILTEISGLYTNLSMFETDIPRKCKMVKRKINLFESIVTELNPRVYVDTIRNLSFDLSSCHQELADLKIQDGVEEHAKKINELCFKAVRYLKMFFQTFQAPEPLKAEPSPNTPPEIPEAWIPTYISGQLALARIYGKFVYREQQQQIQQQEMSLQTYAFLVKFLQSKGGKEKYPLELKMCKEMCDLLPLKITAIKMGRMDLVKNTIST